MTISVNALLEETGAKTAVVTTEGFRDVLEIGRQNRPALYDLSAEKPTPLVPRRRRYELTERTKTERIETPVDESQAHDLARTISDGDVESVAVCLLHSYSSPENEKEVADILRENCNTHVSVSHEVLAEFREYERTATTVANAYITPVIDSYIGQLETRADDLGVPTPQVMQSNAGIADPKTIRERAVTTILSGPAAGVVGADAAVSSHLSDLRGLITFDMGGTSSDVSLVRDGEIERTTDATIGGRPVGVPMVDLTTVGAGGGSIAWVDSGGGRSELVPEVRGPILGRRATVVEGLSQQLRTRTSFWATSAEVRHSGANSCLTWMRPTRCSPKSPTWPAWRMRSLPLVAFTGSQMRQ